MAALAVLGCGSAERKDEPPRAPGPTDPGETPGPQPPGDLVQPAPTPAPPTPVPKQPTPRLAPPPVEPKPPPPPKFDIPVSGPDCVVRGTSPVPKGTPIFDLPRGGRVIATFSGALTPVSVSAFPQTDRTARARVSTVNGAPAFRIDGYVDPARIELYTSRDIAVVGANLAIAAQQRATLLAAGADTLEVEHRIQGTMDQRLKVTAPCSAFSYSLVGGGAPDEQPQGSRGWRMKIPGRWSEESAPTLALHDAPKGALVYTLKLREGSTLLFWGRDPKNGYLHVTGRSDVVIDAWVLQKSLEPMQPGELMTSFVPSPLTGLEVGISGETTVLMMPKNVPIRLRPEKEEPAIGEIEAGTEVFAFAYVDGWARVLPKSLTLKPPDDASFWVKQTDIMP